MNTLFLNLSKYRMTGHMWKQNTKSTRSLNCLQIVGEPLFCGMLAVQPRSFVSTVFEAALAISTSIMKLHYHFLFIIPCNLFLLACTRCSGVWIKTDSNYLVPLLFATLNKCLSKSIRWTSCLPLIQCSKHLAALLITYNRLFWHKTPGGSGKSEQQGKTPCLLWCFLICGGGLKRWLRLCSQRWMDESLLHQGSRSISSYTRAELTGCQSVWRETKLGQTVFSLSFQSSGNQLVLLLCH